MAKVELSLLTPGESAVVLALGELSVWLSAVEATLKKGQAPVYNRGTATAGPLTVAIDLREVGAATLEVMVRSSVAATFYVEGSVDGVNWTVKDTLTLAAPGERHEGYMNAYPVVRVRTEDVGDHEIELVAAR
ncbi:MAG: hypothetical protein AAB270_08410 [Chloroflexota bacterium]